MSLSDHPDAELRKMLEQATSARNAASARADALIDELRARSVGSLEVGAWVPNDGYDACHRFKEPVDSRNPGEFRGLCGRKGIVGVTAKSERSFAYHCRACEKKPTHPVPATRGGAS